MRHDLTPKQISL